MINQILWLFSLPVVIWITYRLVLITLHYTEKHNPVED